MIKVAINVLPLSSGHATRGIGVYTKNLIEHLEKSQGINLMQFERLDQVIDADVVHYPFFDFFAHTLPFSKKFPTVVTIHDVIPLLFPDHFPRGITGSLKLLMQKFALKNADAIITDSNSSKKDIEKILSFSSEKIYPISLAPDDHFKVIKSASILGEVKKKYSLPDKFVLYTGNVNWNKNILTLAESCLKAESDCVIIGGSFLQTSNLDHPELMSLKQFQQKYAKNPKIHMIGYVDRRDLVAITNLAALFLFPSYYEGFGLPVLEAQKCGVPVICSNRSSLPEVAGEGAVYVDPENSTEIARLIVQLEHETQLRNKLIQKGFENVQKFSWLKTAQQTIDIYRKTALHQ